jgi:hypothetical protein
LRQVLPAEDKETDPLTVSPTTTKSPTPLLPTKDERPKQADASGVWYVSIDHFDRESCWCDISISLFVAIVRLSGFEVPSTLTNNG